ncbi:MAG TPA: lysophospholipid acyltransferase family protein, partial [Mycobacteriales bacterium]|nr:lysophospholipid acyltransferase family protein [Mycobacteriales bacterium]
MSARRTDPTRESIPLMLARRLAARLLRGYFRLRIVGLEHLPAEGPVLVAGNHSGFLDGPIVMIMLSRPSSFLAKSELYKGALKKVLEFARQIPIHRGTPDRAGLRAGLRVLAGGGVLGVFPEGTRGTGELASIQHGIGYLALHGHCPIVPVVCKGTAEALPKGKAVPRFRAPVDVVFGAPFTLVPDGDPRTRAAMADAAEQIRARLLEHLSAVTSDA